MLCCCFVVLYGVVLVSCYVAVLLLCRFDVMLISCCVVVLL